MIDRSSIFERLSRIATDCNLKNATRHLDFPDSIPFVELLVYKILNAIQFYDDYGNGKHDWYKVVIRTFQPYDELDFKYVRNYFDNIEIMLPYSVSSFSRIAHEKTDNIGNTICFAIHFGGKNHEEV